MDSVNLYVTHGDPSKPLRIGDLSIPCYVLSDKRRVITQAGILKALSIEKKGAEQKDVDIELHKKNAEIKYCDTEQRGVTNLPPLARFFEGKAVKEHVSGGVTKTLNNPVLFTLPNNGGAAHGYEATILVDLCRALLEARRSRSLRSNQLRIAEQAESVILALSSVGIIALIDEVTGYQESRDSDALRKLLDMYLTKEQSKWAKRFPDEFYRELARLRGWPWSGRRFNPPQCVAQYTKDLVYERLAPGVMEELEKLNPVVSVNGRLAKHHQFLTPSVGHQALDTHLTKLLTLMKATDSWKHFIRSVNTVLPKQPHKLQPQLFK